METLGKPLRRSLLEGFVIVASILLAFGIDALWDRYRDSVDRRELVHALELDFETTRSLLDVTISRADSLVSRGRETLLVAKRGDDLPVDSLRFLVRSFFNDITFVPALAAYDAAVGETGLASLGSRAFLEADADFHRSLRFYELHAAISADLYFLGPTLEFRRELGSLGALFREPDECPPQGQSCDYPEEYALDADELRAFISRPDVYGALENILNVNINVRYSLLDMSTAVDRILDALGEVDAGAS